MNHPCPVCAFPALREAPRSKSHGASYEICPSCGFQFGVSDDDGGFTYVIWRAAWKRRGAKWSSRSIAAPRGWNAPSQLATLRAVRAKVAAKKKL